MSVKLDSFETLNWKPLESHEEFRLIELAGCSTGEQLTATLENVTFEAASNEYLALSYTWGGQPLTETIICNGCTVFITKNLHSALWRIHQPENPVHIWCDALCIKQGTDDVSLSERNQQIRLMGKIFSSAIEVVIDLGDDDGTLNQAVEGMNAILRTPQDLRGRLLFEAKPEECLKLPPFTDPMWTALEALLSRPWFFRIWCVEEFVLAREVRVMLGPHTVTIEQLVSVASVYLIVCSKAAREYQTRTWDISKFRTPMLATECLLATWQRRTARHALAADATNTESLCQLMISTMAQHTTDPRDRVYALYGMLGPQFADKLPVDHTETTAELGCRLSEYFLRHGNGIWMLVYCCGINVNRPSWTIDLTSLGVRHKMSPLWYETQPDGTNALYSAGGHPTTANMYLRSSSDSLEVKGVIADVVEHTPPAIALPIDPIFDLGGHQRMTPSLIPEYIKWFTAILRWAEQFSDADVQSDAFWRTLIMNFNPHLDDPERQANGRPKPGFGAYFDLLVAYIRGLDDAEVDFDNMTDEDFQARYRVPAGAVNYWLAAVAPMASRRIIRTQSGRFGLVPVSCEAKDVIAVFHGVPVPFVLRPEKDAEGYQVVGISYIHGLMDGEALQQNLPVHNILLRGRSPLAATTSPETSARKNTISS
ncbi:hypothetical protein H2200_013191 [Cladophialophora chaetospira]|uniref:Heterokaryon incompatibility domain-containing protein n=1 Tax=Cladophialophora chaetospira TaxID=386627 RepID=A0AA38WWB9_9EURO|nr:hypothetical protein H2200_013191 [Cladophialophora chaetospira]